MRTNYASTSQLLELAATMPFLRCFTYMSTAYVNSNLPRHSRVEEKIYPLPGTDDPLAVAQELLDLPPASAERKVCPSFSYIGSQLAACQAAKTFNEED